MTTATLTVPGRLRSTAQPTRQEHRTATARPAAAQAAKARTGGQWLAASHWLGDAFATWASGGRVI